jgi:hypothetical protein
VTSRRLHQAQDRTPPQNDCQKKSAQILSLICLKNKVMTIVGAVSIATGYGLDGPGIESRLGRDIPHLSRPALGLTQPLIQWVPGLSGGGGVKRPGRGVNHPPHLSPRLKKK